MRTIRAAAIREREREREMRDVKVNCERTNSTDGNAPCRERASPALAFAAFPCRVLRSFSEAWDRDRN